MRIKEWILRSFRNRIFAAILLTTLVPILLGDILMLQFQVRRSMDNQHSDAMIQLQRCEDAISDLCLQCDRVAQVLEKSTAVHSVLRNRARDSRIMYQVLAREADDILQYAQVSVYNADGVCDYSTDHTALETELETDWGVLYASRTTNGTVYRRGVDMDTAFQAARVIYGHDGAPLGYIVIQVAWEDLDDLFYGSYSPSSDLAVLDPYWEPVYSSHPARAKRNAAWFREQIMSGVGLSQDESGEYQYWVSREPLTGFFLILQQPLIFNRRVIQSFFSISGLLGLLSLAFCSVCALILSRSLSRPVRQLDQVMGRVEQGDFSIRLETGRMDELGRLAETFNRMVAEYQANLLRSIHDQKELNNAQVRMMQAQLNPHFLYNTLDSMKWLGITHQVPQIANLATDLAALLRSAINAEEFFTLEQELELVERYLDIQYIRFEDKFTCEIDVDDRFQHCRIPKLILQPLVENAIIHGVADQEEGYIKITAAQDEDDLILSVWDDGCGIPESVMEQLRSGLPSAMGKHLGLYNVNQILRLHYGDKYGVTARAVARGSCVELRIPMESV